MALLDDPACLLDWPCDFDKRFLIYLTKTFAGDELHATLQVSKALNAECRVFGLEWNDVAEIASEQRQQAELLGEVAEFLKRRGFERFHGFKDAPVLKSISGFYQRRYFEELGTDISTTGSFYGR